jgi:ATP-dependent Clp protease ATP-binding subunit ClpA
VSFFSGHVVDLLRLAEDEARMLGRVEVEPEHLLLACCRHGPGRDLLAQQSLQSRDLHAAVVRIHREGDDLLLGRLPWSRRSQEVLERVVTVAAERGLAWPGDVEVLLALASDQRAVSVLDEAGVVSLRERIAQEHPSERTPLDDASIRRQLLVAALDEHPRQLQVPVPAFERFTSEARRAIGAAAETAARLEHREVEPFHLLLGCLQRPDSFAAQVLAELWADRELGVIGEAIELACRMGPNPSHQATGIFTEAGRRLVAEDSLALAYRHGHRQITTGHLLLAVLNSGDPTTVRMTRPHTQRLARTLVGGLPGSEHDSGPDSELEWIVLDALMRGLVLDFRRILPPGWTIQGSARSDIHLRLPQSQSESDFQIRPGWITSSPGSGRDRLQEVTQWMLERFQAALTKVLGEPWPAPVDGRLAPAHAQVIPDRYNSRLRLGYGDPESPVLRVVEHDLLIHMMVQSV